MKGTWKNVRVTVDEALFSSPDLNQMIEYAKRGALGLAKAQGWNFKSEPLILDENNVFEASVNCGVE